MFPEWLPFANSTLTLTCPVVAKVHDSFISPVDRRTEFLSEIMLRCTIVAARPEFVFASHKKAAMTAMPSGRPTADDRAMLDRGGVPRSGHDILGEHQPALHSKDVTPSGCVIILLAPVGFLIRLGRGHISDVRREVLWPPASIAMFKRAGGDAIDCD